MDAQHRAAPEGAAPPGLKRWMPVAALIAVMALVYGMGWHEYLSFKTIGLNYESLKAAVDGNLLLAALAYTAAYVAVVALSLPGALIMTLAGGLLFGWQLGAALTVVAATIGATIIFLVARTSFGESLAAKAGPSLAKLRDGFKENALSYLLFLRLVPAFPFFIVNLAPALLGVPLKTYVLGTFLGIIPGTTAFSVAGSGLGSVVEAQNKVYQECLERAGAAGQTACPYTIDTSALVTNELLAAFVALGLVSLLPIALKHLRGRHAEK
jgi:uncharacterized membrane protein YdjX (TVP38/TMEM64 family)